MKGRSRRVIAFATGLIVPMRYFRLLRRRKVILTVLMLFSLISMITTWRWRSLSDICRVSRLSTIQLQATGRMANIGIGFAICSTKTLRIAKHFQPYITVLSTVSEYHIPIIPTRINVVAYQRNIWTATEVLTVRYIQRIAFIHLAILVCHTRQPQPRQITLKSAQHLKSGAIRMRVRSSHLLTWSLRPISFRWVLMT